MVAWLDVEVEPEIRGAYRAGDIRHCYGDASRAAQLLDWRPRTAFEEGMRELAVWLADQTAVDRVDEATAALERRGLTS